MRAVHASWLDLPPEPWKNGGGETRTLAVDAGMPASAAPRWRVSVADIDRDGAYSRFAGYDRVSVVLSGTGVALQGDGVDVMLRPGVPAGFPGDAALQSRLLDGPVRVLNLFVLRGAALASVHAGRVHVPDAADQQAATVGVDETRAAAVATVAGGAAAEVAAGSLTESAQAWTELRITVAGADFYIDPPCPHDARPGEGRPDDARVEQTLPPGAVLMVLRMVAPALF